MLYGYCRASIHAPTLPGVSRPTSSSTSGKACSRKILRRDCLPFQVQPLHRHHRVPGRQTCQYLLIGLPNDGVRNVRHQSARTTNTPRSRLMVCQSGEFEPAFVDQTRDGERRSISPSQGAHATPQCAPAPHAIIAFAILGMVWYRKVNIKSLEMSG